MSSGDLRQYEGEEAEMDWNGWGWLWMGLMMILFWGGLIVLVTLLLRGGGFSGRRSQTGGPLTSGPDATEILRARFARGEISEEEYRKSLTVLDETRR
jgi:putative membrane protein